MQPTPDAARLGPSRDFACDRKFSGRQRATHFHSKVIGFAPASTVGQGVLARTVSRYEGCSTGQDTLFWVTEFDMEINSNIAWQYGPGEPDERQFDFETVMLHELGHAQQLSHVILPRAVMHYAIELRALVRDLSTADIAGGNLVVANSTGPNMCAKPPMVLHDKGICNPLLRKLQVYPNPVDEETQTVTLLYHVEGTATLEARLYDTAGRLVRAYDLTFGDTNLPVELEMGDLAAGLYILKWLEEDSSGSVKILKR